MDGWTAAPRRTKRTQRRHSRIDCNTLQTRKMGTTVHAVRFKQDEGTGVGKEGDGWKEGKYRDGALVSASL